MIEILSDREIARIIQHINPNCFLGARLYLMVLLLLDTGIRASELCTLTLDNTFIEENYIKVTGKGNKERIVPFGATTKKALIRYATTWRPEPVHSDVNELILSVEGRPLSYSGLSHALKRLGQRAGVPRLHAHLFRHTFAVRYLMNGGDVMTLRLMLGHTTLDVTQMYMHLAEAHVKVQHSRFSPVDRLRLGRRRRQR
jgi:integrase/recombinase XerC/integrase/recombinase XerD